jgi:hypothetical protein
VTNGVYATGRRAVGTNILVNRVVLDKPLVLRSVNGPEATLIVGAKTPGGTNGDGAIRCVYLINGASLQGFTLTNGATRAFRSSGDEIREEFGGGLWCESTNALVVNCVFIGNTCGNSGAATRGATLNKCVLISNDAYYDGGGAAQSVLNDCLIAGNTAGIGTTRGMPIGGGAWDSTLTRCTLSNNLSSCEAGGAGQSRLYFCTLVGNSAPYGGGAWGGELHSCTLIGNTAREYGGGALCATLNNCVLSSNSAVKAGGGAMGGWDGIPSTLSNCTLTRNSAPVGGRHGLYP